MLTPCTQTKPTSSNLQASQTIPALQRAQMTNVASTTKDAGATTPGIWSDVNMVEMIPCQPDSTLTPSCPETTLPEMPQFQVPANPLLPPGYQETLSYDHLQYMNGFLRTQIGKYLRVEQLVTTSQIEDRFGYLVGVGVNYILLQQPGTGNITAIDYYSIKLVYVYYNQEPLPL